MLEPDPELAVAYGIFSVRQARSAGHSRADIERRVRRGTWFRTDGLLLATGRESQATDSLVRAALLAGPQAVVGFSSAAHLHGWDFADRPRAPQLISSSNGVRGVYRCRLNSDEVAVMGVLRVTVPLRTALDLAATLGLDEAVAALDSGLRSGLSLRALTQSFDQAHRPGIRNARRALALADPKSGSVVETEARLLFARAGLPAPVSQFTLSCGELAVFDFAWEFARVAVEIDGFRYHSAEGDFQRDRTKQNAAQLKGWRVLRFTVADVRLRPAHVIAVIREALGL